MFDLYFIKESCIIIEYNEYTFLVAHNILKVEQREIRKGFLFLMTSIYHKGNMNMTIYCQHCQLRKNSRTYLFKPLIHFMHLQCM